MLKKTVVIITLAMLSIASVAQAKDLQIAFVNGQQIFEKNRHEIDERLVKEFGARKEVIVKLQESLKASLQRLDRESATMSKEEAEKLKHQAEGQQRDLQRLGQAYQEDFSLRGNQELQKLGDKLQAAVEKYATQHHLDIVLQRGAAVFIDKGYDITDKIVAQL